MSLKDLPSLQPFDIWCDGMFASTGYDPHPFHVGTAEGINFSDACQKLYKEKGDGSYHHRDGKDYEYWGQLYNNPIDAYQNYLTCLESRRKNRLENYYK